MTVRRADQHAGQSPCQCVIPEDVLIQLIPPDDERLSLETCRGWKINTLKKVKKVRQVGCKSRTPNIVPVYRIKFSLLYLSGFILQNFNTIKTLIEGPVSVVGIATAYGLDDPGIESRWGRDFPHLSRPALRPTQPPVQWFFPGGKVRPARDADPSPPSSVPRSKIE
jgi:hypothetical protein